jgi:hypothetical protein
METKTNTTSTDIIAAATAATPLIKASKKWRAALALFAAVAATMVIAATAAPAMAHVPSAIDPAIKSPVQLGDIGQISGDTTTTSLSISIVPGLIKPGDLHIPDLNGLQVVSPGDTDDSTPSTEAPNTTDSTVVKPGDTAPGDNGILVVIPAETTTTSQATTQTTDDGSVGTRLPFTGGSSTPWLIIGAVIVLAGIAGLVITLGRPKKAGN